MQITLVQTDVHFMNKRKNIQALKQRLAKEESLGDIILLPELFSTGYLFDNAHDIQALSESVYDGETVQALQQIACEYDRVIVAGMAERDGDQFYNTAVVIGKQGLISRYRKIALTNVDKGYFSRGEDTVTFQYQGLTVGIVICFDLWFPEVVRRYTEKKTDILLHLANFGGEQTLYVARTRAVENSCFVCTCNRIGTENTAAIQGWYRGNSQIVDPAGNLVFTAGQETEVKTVALNVSRASARQFAGMDLLKEISVINSTLAESEPNR